VTIAARRSALLTKSNQRCLLQQEKGLKVEDRVKSAWVYKRLAKFSACIEGNISCLKRRYGLTRCTWQGKEKFKAFVWASTVAYNLMLLARLNIAT
jgi:IS5 family transposase